jgi:hypothetical protein
LIDRDYLSRLYVAIRQSRAALKPFREKRLEALKLFVGSHYGGEVGSEYDKTPTNFLEMAVMIYVRALAASQPQAMIQTVHKQLRPFANKLELALNHLLEHRLNLEDEFQLAVMESLFSVGILKVGIGASDTVKMGNYNHDIGQPFAEAVTLDDWVWDMEAKRVERCAFMGHRVRVSLDELKDSGIYNKKRLEKLGETFSTSANLEGDERPQMMSSGGTSGLLTNELEKWVEIWEIWLPRQGVILTLDLDGEGEPLREVEWDGPTSGPYKFLSFQPVLDNIMPLPPVALWRDLHELANRLFRKIARQAERQKTILGVQVNGDEDARRVTDAADGEAVRVDNPDRVRELRFGGADQAGVGVFLAIKDLINMFGGNLEVLGGLSPQAQTLGQEELIAASASKRIQVMQDRTIKFARESMRDLAWWLWTDPLIELPLVYRVPGTKIDVNMTYSARDRAGEFLDYNIGINPYSLQGRSPGQQVQSFMSMWQTVIMPSMQAMEAQGVAVNMAGVIKFLAKRMGLDEMDELIEFATAAPDDIGPVVSPGAKKPSHTTRTYERVNRPGRTRRGTDFALMQTMFGGGVQPEEQANAMRGGGNY